MLVIGRKPGEQIRIGDDVTVKVFRNANGGIYLGIDAPRDIAIHREEVFNAIQQRKELQANDE